MTTHEEEDRRQYLRSLIEHAMNGIAEALPASRERALTLTKLEEAGMWLDRTLDMSEDHERYHGR